MSNDIRIKKGLDIHLKGEAKKAREAAILSNFYTIRPEDFHSVIPKLVAKEGAKVKAYVHFRGRTIVFKERGELLLLRFLKELEEYGAAEALPKMEGRRMIVVVAPKKIKKK